MNERIKQLAIIANPSSKEIYEADNWQYNCAAWDSNNLTKFAELIVRECCDIVGDYYGQGKKSGPGYTMICEIKKHFGVEEK